MADIPLRPDIKAAADRMDTKFGAKREIQHLTQYLWEGERVEYMVAGTYGPGNGLLVLTDRRLLFVVHGMVKQATEDFPLEKVSSVQWTSGMLSGTLTIYASGNKAEIKNVSKNGGKALADIIRARLSSRHSTPAPAPTPPPAAPPAPPASAAPAGDGPLFTTKEEVFAALKQLAELHQAGVLSDEEFNTKKAELLSRI